MIQLSNKRTTILTALILVIAGQLNINIIVHGFTISMSIVFFLLFAYLFTDFHPFLTTILAAPLMVITRGIIEWLSGAGFLSSVLAYLPEVIFIILYGAMFSFYMKRVSFYSFRLAKFTPLIGIDFFANIVEILIRLGAGGLTVSVLWKLFIIAVGRTIIAVTLVAAFNYYGNFMIRKEEQQRYKNLLMLMADLKSEMIWMNKNTREIENITASAYDIYQYIKENGDQEYQAKSLELAKDIHEIKKEYFLIMRGINDALAEEETSDRMNMSYLLQILQESLQTHYKCEGERLQIEIEVKSDFVTDKPYFVLSVLRNLVTNAIEAGKGQNEIRIMVSEQELEDSVVLTVEDNCGGIEKENLSEIFKPGFSTKIDYEKGNTGRGLGLSIVKDLVEIKLAGNINVETTDAGTRFIIEVPKEEMI